MIILFKKQPILYLLIIFVLAAFLRFYGLNWDQGFHLHPDERAIVMFTTPLSFPSSIQQFLSESSPWNPHFFAYGSFPIYLLKTVGSVLANFDHLYSAYEKINLVGRAISAIADIGTIILLYFLAKKLFNQTVALLASFFYAISVFPIQAAHFFAVDTLLTFFITLTLYQLIRFYEKPSISNSILVGILFGLSLATKTSATPLVTAIVVAIAVDFILLVIKQPHKPHIWFPHIPRFLKRLIFDSIIIVFTTSITFFILQPYAIIDFQEFLRQTQQVSQVMYNAYAFPFTLQYVGKIPYLYELKNIFLWGQGPILSMLSFAGFFYTLFIIFKKQKKVKPYSVQNKWAQELILLTFLISYFFIVGKFAVGFMRYLLPLYPLLSLFAALFVWRLYILIKNKLKIPTPLFIILSSLFIILVFVWPLSFMHIYTKPNTRVLATNWINQNIPFGSTIAIEHWDDGLPLFGQQNYRVLTLELYNPDTPSKWQIINQQLALADYIIIASNRLYVPLTKLTNCKKLPVGRCYTQTAEYYKRLFGGQNVIIENNESSQGDSSITSFPRNYTKVDIRFQKVAEFSTYPKLKVSSLEFEVNDSSADESFTVYDHPKIMIFKKQNQSLMQNF